MAAKDKHATRLRSRLGGFLVSSDPDDGGGTDYSDDQRDWRKPKINNRVGSSGAAKWDFAAFALFSRFMPIARDISGRATCQVDTRLSAESVGRRDETSVGGCLSLSATFRGHYRGCDDGGKQHSDYARYLCPIIGTEKVFRM